MNRNQSENYKFSDTELDILMHYFPNGIVAFDLEMTGLSPIFDKIIEIAAIKINKDRTIEYFHRLINPQIPIPEKTIAYHGITDEQVKSMCGLKKPLKEFVSFYSNFPLLAHNAHFDIGYIVKANYENGNSFSLSSIYDSCKFARAIYKKDKDTKPENFKLSTLANFFAIPFKHHLAMDDSYACLKVFMNCLIVMRKKDAAFLVKDLAYLFKLNSFKKASDYILPSKLEGMKSLIQNQQECEIIYKGGTNGSEYRRIKPISILPMPQGLVLYAKCLISEHNKHFLIKKIKDFK